MKMNKVHSLPYIGNLGRKLFYSEKTILVEIIITLIVVVHGDSESGNVMRGEPYSESSIAGRTL